MKSRRHVLMACLALLHFAGCADAPEGTEPDSASQPCPRFSEVDPTSVVVVGEVEWGVWLLPGSDDDRICSGIRATNDTEPDSALASRPAPVTDGPFGPDPYRITPTGDLSSDALLIQTVPEISNVMVDLGTAGFGIPTAAGPNAYVWVGDRESPLTLRFTATSETRAATVECEFGEPLAYLLQSCTEL